MESSLIAKNPFRYIRRQGKYLCGSREMGVTSCLALDTLHYWRLCGLVRVALSGSVCGFIGKVLLSCITHTDQKSTRKGEEDVKAVMAGVP